MASSVELLSDAMNPKDEPSYKCRKSYDLSETCVCTGYFWIAIKSLDPSTDSLFQWSSAVAFVAVVVSKGEATNGENGENWVMATTRAMLLRQLYWQRRELRDDRQETQSEHYRDPILFCSASVECANRAELWPPMDVLDHQACMCFPGLPSFLVDYCNARILWTQ